MHDLYMTSGMVAQVQISILNPPFYCQFSGVKTMPTNAILGVQEFFIEQNIICPISEAQNMGLESIYDDFVSEELARVSFRVQFVDRWCELKIPWKSPCNILAHIKPLCVFKLQSELGASTFEDLATLPASARFPSRRPRGQFQLETTAFPNESKYRFRYSIIS